MNRWSRIAAVVLMCGSAPPATADGWHAGVRGGVTAANFRGDDAELADLQGSVWPALGVLVSWDINPWVAVQSEFLYVRRGAVLPSWDHAAVWPGWSGDRVHWKLDYLEMPLLLRVTPSPKLPHSVYAVAGATVGFAIRNKLQAEYARPELRRLEDLRPVDVGISAGLGAQLPAGRYRVQVEARYTGGVTDLLDGRYDSGIRNSTFVFTTAVTR